MRDATLGGLLVATMVASAVIAGAIACSDASQGVGGTSSDSAASQDSGGGLGPCPQLQFPATCPAPPPSWKDEVQVLVGKYCGQCHGNGSSAATQLNLSTYAKVAANRTKCWYQIYQCWMPNQDGSPPPLAYPTPAERQAMVTWMDICNAPNN